jgi:alpha-1,2-mannosyltransferase
MTQRATGPALQQSGSSSAPSKTATDSTPGDPWLVHADRRGTRSRLAAPALFTGLLSLFLLTSQSRPTMTDVVATSASAWKLGRHGTLILNDLPHTPWLVHGLQGLVTNRFPGSVFWAAPFYWAFGSNDPLNNMPGAVAAATASAAAMTALFLILRRLVSDRVALVATLVMALATPTWTVSADSLFTHGPAQMLLLIGMMLIARQSYLSGFVSLGLATLVRPHLIVVSLTIGLVVAWRERRPRALVCAVVGAATGALLLVAYNHHVYGVWDVRGGYRATMTDPGGVGLGHFAINVIGTFLSAKRGIFILTPFFVMLVPGLRAAWQAAPIFVRASTLGGVVYTLTQLWLIRFTGGDGFYPYRVTIEGLTLCAPLMVLAWTEWTSRTQDRRTWFAGLTTATLAVQALAAVINWVPEGADWDPWHTFLPLNMLHHIGGRSAALFVSATAVGTVLAMALTHRSWRPANAPAAAPQSGLEASGA